MKSEIARNLLIESSGFGFEIEVIAKCQKLGVRIFEVPISYYGRTYQEGKKIGLKDGFAAIWYLLKFNLFRTRDQSFRLGFLEAFDLARQKDQDGPSRRLVFSGNGPVQRVSRPVQL